MTLRVATPIGGTYSGRFTFAFINNMPDAAFEATERQFFSLLDQGSGSQVVDVQRYALAGVPRGDQTAHLISETCLPISALYERVPDVLVVTGSNPVEIDVRDEPYWDELAELLTWSRDRVEQTLLSCLSAHAALTVFDDIERVRLSTKCTGVFSQNVAPDHELTRGIPSVITLPHSRWNTVPRHRLERVGYRPVIFSEETDWAVMTREQGGRQLTLVQGHPEYDPSSLLREYRRDAGRYLRHERDETPCLPYHCTSDEDWPQMEYLHREVVEGDRNPKLIEDFPFDEVGARTPWSWRDVALRFYTNWLSSVVTKRE